MKSNQDPYRKQIIALSVLVPLTIAILFGVKIEGYDLSFLPHVYATINGLTAILLITAVAAIKNKRVSLARPLMKKWIVRPCLFLIMYVLYHMTSESTPFGGEGWIRRIYFFILASHILLSVGVIPLVLFTFVRALSGDFERHPAFARFTFPVWH